MREVLRQRFHFCSSGVKNKLFTTFFLIIHVCSMGEVYQGHFPHVRGIIQQLLSNTA